MEIIQRNLWEGQGSKFLQMRARKQAYLLRQPERERQAEQKRLRRLRSLRHAMAHSYQEREQWYTKQSPRRCEGCGLLRPAKDYGGVCNAYGFFPYSRCSICHEVWREYHQFTCRFCQKKTDRQNFISQYNGYALCGNGSWLPLCCKECEAALQSLSSNQQREYIHTSCQRAFPVGQVIYAEVDPETDDVRYIGRTSKPTQRHAQHVRDADQATEMWKPESRKANWIQALANRGLKPSMHILQEIAVSPLVVEWEQRYIWHGIQRTWRLLNAEAMDEGLVTRIKAAHLDFLSASFEQLMQEAYFPAYGIEAFLHAYA